WIASLVALPADGLLDNRWRFCQTLFAMFNPFSNRPMGSGRGGIQSLSIFLVIAVLLAMGVVWLSSRIILQRSLTKKIPGLPDLGGLHRSFRDQILRLDAEVRSDPRSVQKIMALGLTYHANDSFQEARSCYQLAIGLAPRDYRWWYYLAIVEEMQGDEDH